MFSLNVKYKKVIQVGFVTFAVACAVALYSTLGTPSTTQPGPLPVKELVGKTEEQIKNDYSSRINNYSDIGSVPSGKVKITGFDIGDINIQVDYALAKGQPVYIGYSFAANPKAEDVAWRFTGFEKPKASGSSEGAVNTVVYWENTQEIQPFRNVTIIYDTSGRVGKISFSMEDITTAKSIRSLYHVN